jgi:hypothetical protein
VSAADNQAAVVEVTPESLGANLDVGEKAETLAAEVRALREQLQSVQDYAWKRGYDACRAGEQRHSPYRAVRGSNDGGEVR